MTRYSLVLGLPCWPKFVWSQHSTAEIQPGLLYPQSALGGAAEEGWVRKTRVFHNVVRERACLCLWEVKLRGRKLEREITCTVKEWQQIWEHKLQSQGNYKGRSLKERLSLDKVTFGASLVSQLDEGRRGLLSISGRKEERKGWREKKEMTKEYQNLLAGILVPSWQINLNKRQIHNKRNE